MGITMKNIVRFIVICFAFAKASTAIAQNYKQHVVAQGETIYAIIKKYDISEEQLYELNPDLKLGLKAGATLVLPANAGVLTQAKIIKYKTHRVGRKETLYAISKEYGVTVLDIKESNKELYTTELKKGDKLKIPVFDKTNLSAKTTSPAESSLHEVQPKETKFGIAKKYGLTVEALDKLNPGVENIQPGMFLKISQDSKQGNASTVATTNYVEYVVPAKMTMYSLETITGLNEEAITALNPALKNGLKAGMVLRLPNAAFGVAGDKESGSLLGIKLPLKNKNYKEQRIALLLPFSLEKVDNIATDLNRLKKDLAMRVSTDFYMGAVVAVDSAMSVGVSVILDVYDTHKNASRIDSLITRNDFNSYTAIVGPLLSKNVEQFALKMPNKNIPIISPIALQDGNQYANVFQARPNEKLLRKKLLDYLKRYAARKNVIIITDNQNQSLQSPFRSLFPDAVVITPGKSNYISRKDYLEALVPTNENVIILAVEDTALADDTVLTYSKKTAEFKIRIFAYEEFKEAFIPKEDLASTGFTFPSVNYHQGTKNAFYKSFIAKHGKTPNEYAVRGFDVTFDAIMRQQAANGIFGTVQAADKTMMVENPFHYVKKSNDLGYENNSFFLLQYTRYQTLRRIE